MADTEALTQGLWFHGSPVGDLEQIKSRYELNPSPSANNGIYFARDPWVASMYARQKYQPGWIYAARIFVRSPLSLTTKPFLAGSIPKDRYDELRRSGHDCVLSPFPGTTAWPPPQTGRQCDEIVILQPISPSVVTIIGRVSVLLIMAEWERVKKTAWRDPRLQAKHADLAMGQALKSVFGADAMQPAYDAHQVIWNLQAPEARQSGAPIETSQTGDTA